jgi:hypothetical protein
MDEIVQNEEWYLSERLGYDCRSTPYGRKLLRERVAEVVLSGAGAWMKKMVD